MIVYLLKRDIRLNKLKKLKKTEKPGRIDNVIYFLKELEKSKKMNNTDYNIILRSMNIH